MRQLIKLLLLLLLLCLPLSDSLAQKSTRRTRKRSQPPVICKLESVPKGFVVVGYQRNLACNDGFELRVKRPENGDIVCAESPVPPQFATASEARGDSVGTCPGKAFLIVSATSRASAEQSALPVDNENAIGRAFATRTSGIHVEGRGTVTRVLPDDVNGPRHQRFIIELASGQTLLITHNLDIAPRIDGLQAGDSVRFSGEYVWNEKGGVIHWTHHDPQGRHVAGWILHNGRTYR